MSNLRKNFLCIVWHQKPTVKNINYVMPQILKLSCVSFNYVSISYVLAFKM